MKAEAPIHYEQRRTEYIITCYEILLRAKRSSMLITRYARFVTYTCLLAFAAMLLYAIFLFFRRFFI